MKNEQLRNIPKIDQLLQQMPEHNLPPHLLTQWARKVTHGLREKILDGTLEQVPPISAICTLILEKATLENTQNLRRVINATGVILHTNFGRACLSHRAVKAVSQVAQGYSTLEYDLETGARGHRDSHVEGLLQNLTGAQAAMVVNNNAAAVLIILSALAAGGEVITSRGELVEIGGSFRIPEIMESCGCILREVGATNKTHLYDYQRAIGENTRALLKVHTSNYKIMGFTETVKTADLVALGNENNLPVIEDLGSGALVPLSPFGLEDEPTVQSVVAAGVDIVCFSGDKLLGGPQAGIIVGKEAYISLLKRHPLARAMRVDKMTYAALEATLRSYFEKTHLSEIPTLSMLGESTEVLMEKAKTLAAQLDEHGVYAAIRTDKTQVGGGSVPTQLLDTVTLEIKIEGKKPDQIERELRAWRVPILGRISQDRYLLDVRTLRHDDADEIVAALSEMIK